MRRVRKTLDAARYETIVFAATGSGDRAMEDLIEQGRLDGVIDITISQLGQGVVRGDTPGGPRRLAVAGALGLPQVVTFGGLDILNCQRGDFRIAEAAQGMRLAHQHSPTLTAVRPTVEESGRIGREVAARLNQATASDMLAVLIPKGGFSEYSVPGAPLYDPLAGAALISAFMDEIAPTVSVQMIEAAINAPEFADALARTFVAMTEPIRATQQ